MKAIGYKSVRFLIKGLLQIYFKRIYIHGVSDVPRGKPVLFLPNHQNAFLDTILIATACNRSPYFLTRSDVFKTPLLIKIFSFCKMIPIYRMRDGINSLKHNESTFDHCVQLLNKSEAIVVFPEANHNLQRRVRPLSKGFMRILISTLEKNPDLDIQLIPVGLNYVNAANFPDSAAVYYGKPISVQKLYDASDIQGSINRIKEIVFENLTTLTTHIDTEDYDITISKLNSLNTDYLIPKEVNETLLNITTNTKKSDALQQLGWFSTIKILVFKIVNSPVILFWNNLKPKVKEIEFLSTFRFAFSILIYPIYYFTIFILMSLIWDFSIGFFIVLCIGFFNLLYTKI